MFSACLAVFVSVSAVAAGGDEVVVLSETFDSSIQQDPLRSGSGQWGGGKLVPGPGGGSGRLGDLIVRSGETLLLSTDSQVVPPGGLLDNYDPVTGMPGEASALVEGGVFEFAYVDVEAGGTLRFDGDHPARLYARGALEIDGVVDVSGESLPLFPSMPCDVKLTDPFDPFFCDALAPEDFLGQAGGRGGPGGGDGGKGGDLPDAVDMTLLEACGLHNPNAFIDLDGQDGEGIPVPNSLAPTGLAGGGEFGVHWPLNLPTSTSELGDLVLDDSAFNALCYARQTGGGGAGGAHATPGAPANNATLTAPSGGPVAPDAAGGDPGAILADPLAHTLDPRRGLLRGGAGGSGAGASVADTQSNGVIFDCVDEAAGPPIHEFRQSRGGGGGGGGGAFQGQAGARLTVSGQVLASGGQGAGSGNVAESIFSDRLDDTSPGGGGAGGAILLQAPEVQLAAQPGRLDVSGGFLSKGAENAVRGGHGGAGFVRVESGLPLDFDDVVAGVAPDAATLDDDYAGSPVHADFVSVDEWTTETSQPGSFSGVQSCWIFPEGQPSDVTFVEDDVATLGWNLLVLPSAAGVDPLPFRGRNDTLQSSLEQLLGSDLGSAPIVVRFQGARADSLLADPCDVDVHDPAGPIVPGSLTPWVRHPAELNQFARHGQSAPNLIRFQIVFDRRHPLQSFIEGVTDLVILTAID